MTIPTANSPSTKTLQLQNRQAELARLAAWIAELAEEAALDPRSTFRVELALTEAVTNVIEHGLGSDGAATITIRAIQTPAALTLTVADDGPPFDPLQMPDHLAPNSLEEAEIGGLGVHLLRRYTDACAYSREGKRNLLSLIFHRAEETGR